MQLHLTALGLMALGGMELASSHIVRMPLASTANIDRMDGTAAPALLSSAKTGLETRAWVPHDIPDHPHCTYKGADSLMYMVFSKDFGRHDETSKDGCGNHMLLRLREGTFSYRRICVPALCKLFSFSSLASISILRVNWSD